MRFALEKTVKQALPYVADAGAVAYVTIAVFALVVAVAEFSSPGLVSGVVAPQTIVACLALAGAFALVAPSEGRSRASSLAFAAIGVAGAAFAFWSAWYYFSPVPDMRGRLAAFAAIVVGLLFAAGAMPAPKDV
ncbi:MAG TPA: hypothetical protein VL500_01580 [Candidatus Eisenbacteria bacterium]|nr:hypothetical protein [Candidatus Eisenbacteria bacterium]